MPALLVTRRRILGTLRSIYHVLQDKRQDIPDPADAGVQYIRGYERALQMLCRSFGLPADAFSNATTGDNLPELDEVLYLEDVKGTIDSTWFEATKGPALPEDDVYRQGFEDAFDTLRIRLVGRD